jgi:hypothetical protein
MDAGVELNDRTILPAAKELGLEMEYLATEKRDLQDSVLISNIYDENGVLLYPDGAPRFRILYTVGGKATKHGNSLSESGRNNIRNFYFNGGSYVGTCAGAFIAGLGTTVGINNPAYYHIWPGYMYGAYFPTGNTNHTIPGSSPILQYFDFGNDNHIQNVYFAGGGYAYENGNLPAGTEEILRYDMPDFAAHNTISCWAYKKNVQSGRFVAIGCHPEGYSSGEQLSLMEALILYALDGQGSVQLKDELFNNQTRFMDQSTSDNNPDYCKIGDMQYHHYKVTLPDYVNYLNIELDSKDSKKLQLYLKFLDYAFEDSSDYSAIDSGLTKSIQISSPQSGSWYIGVKCADVVVAKQRYWGYAYVDNLQVLNGISYSIVASWDTVTTINNSAASTASFVLHQNYPNPFNPKTVISYQLPVSSEVELSISNLLGQKVVTLINRKQNAGKHTIEWNAGSFSSGIYFYHLQAGEFVQTKRMLLIK